MVQFEVGTSGQNKIVDGTAQRIPAAMSCAVFSGVTDCNQRVKPFVPPSITRAVTAQRAITTKLYHYLEFRIAPPKR